MGTVRMLLGKSFAVLGAVAVVVGSMGGGVYVGVLRGTIFAMAVVEATSGYGAASAEPDVKNAPSPEPVAPVVGPLGNTGTITGRVVDPTISTEIWEAHMQQREKPKAERTLDTMFKPWPDVKVTLAGLKKMASVQTDESGVYRFADIPPGDYVMRVVAPLGVCPMHDARNDALRKVQVKPGETATVDFKLQPGIRVAGRVTDGEGKPVVEAAISAVPIVTVSWDQSYARVEDKARVSTISGPDGGFVLDGIVPASLRDAARLVMSGENPGGVVELVARAKGYASSRMFVHAVTQAQADEAKALLAKLKRERPSPELDKPAPESVPLAACTESTLTGLNFALVPEALVSGVLKTTRGQPVAKATLRMQFEEKTPPVTRADDGSGDNVVYFVGKPLEAYRVPAEPVQTDGAGRFAFEALSAGVYTFEVERDACRKQQARNKPLSLAAGQRLADLELIVEAPEERQDLSGMVVDAKTRQPLRELTARIVEIKSETEASPQLGKMQTGIGEPGQFRFTGVTPGAVLLEVGAPGHASERFRIGLSTATGQDGTYPVFPEATVTGQVTLNGQPKDTQVTARHTEGWPEPYQYSDKKTGEYTIKGLRPGRYDVGTYMWMDGPTSTQRAEHREVVVEAGTTSRVDLDFVGSAVVRGKFLCPKDLTGFVNILPGSVEIVPPHNSPEYLKLIVAGAWDFRRSDTYAIPNIPAGDYLVVGSIAAKEEGKLNRIDMQRHRITLHERETVTLDFDFSRPTSDDK